jgi:dolichol-phosphate mannosyltransferase
VTGRVVDRKGAVAAFSGRLYDRDLRIGRQGGRRFERRRDLDGSVMNSPNIDSPRPMSRDGGVETPLLSIIATARDEEANIGPFVAEIAEVFEPAGISFELIVVDDDSTDATGERLREAMARYDWLRVVRMTNRPRGRDEGKGPACCAGFRAARGELIGALDADLQDDPRDLLATLEVMRESGADMVNGDRSQSRRDTLKRRGSSMIGRLFRKWLLGDSIRDTGAPIKLMKREVALALPLWYRGMHRFMPVIARQLGYTVVEMPVKHRPRMAGETKYGIWNRALPGLVDCLAVRWMRKRWRDVSCEEIVREAPAGEELASAAEPVVEPEVPAPEIVTTRTRIEVKR